MRFVHQISELCKVPIDPKPYRNLNPLYIRFRSFAKVGTGLSFAEQKDMAKFLESKERCVASDKMKKEQPVAGMPDHVYKIRWPGGETCYFSSKKPQGVIDVFIDPSKSKIGNPHPRLTLN